MMQATPKHTPTPAEAIENIGSVVVELHALTGLLDHLATSTVEVSKDQVGVIANSLAAAVGAIDRTASEVIQAWKAEKDRATLLLANLELTEEQASRAAALVGEGGAR
jgi:hypothetical protein